MNAKKPEPEPVVPDEPIHRREPVLVAAGAAAAVVAIIQAALPYLPEFGVPVKYVTLITTILGFLGFGVAARKNVVSPATFRRETGRDIRELGR